MVAVSKLWCIVWFLFQPVTCYFLSQKYKCNLFGDTTDLAASLHNIAPHSTHCTGGMRKHIHVYTACIHIGVNCPKLGGTIPNLYATSHMILLHSQLFSSFQLEFTSDIQTFACSIRIVPLFFAFSRFFRDAIPIFLCQTLTGMHTYLTPNTMHFQQSNCNPHALHAHTPDTL